MNRATPEMRALAKLLITFDAAGIAPSAAENPATFPVIDKLRPHLATLMGDGGFRALLLRALVLAKVEAPFLSGISVHANGGLEGLDTLRSQPDTTDASAGKVVLVAQLLGLLAAFIGPTLASHVVGEVWPQFPPGDRDFGKEAKSEEAK